MLKKLFLLLLIPFSIQPVFEPDGFNLSSSYQIQNHGSCSGPQLGLLIAEAWLTTNIAYLAVTANHPPGHLKKTHQLIALFLTYLAVQKCYASYICYNFLGT